MARITVLLNDVGAGDVSRHQVRGELDPLKVQVHGVGQCPNHERLGESRYTFQQAMAARQNGNDKLFNDVFLPDNNPADLFSNFATGLDEPSGAFLVIRRHRHFFVRHCGTLFRGGDGGGIEAGPRTPRLALGGIENVSRRADKSPASQRKLNAEKVNAAA